MLFLITKKQKDKVLDEYYSYLINIFSINLFILLIVFLAVIFPTYLMMNVNKDLLNSRIEPLKNISNKNLNKDDDALNIINDITLLSMPIKNNSLDIYKEIKGIYSEIPNVNIIGVNVDTVSKKVTVIANVDSKDTASSLVDRLNNSRFKGADLPYSVFSQNKNFIFNQTLSYE